MDLPLLSLSLNDDTETGMTPEERRNQAIINKRIKAARLAAAKKEREKMREAARLAKQNNPTPRAKPAKKKEADSTPAPGPKPTPGTAFSDEDEDLQPVQKEDQGYDSWGTFSDDEGAKEPGPPGPLAQAFFESKERIKKEEAEKEQRERMEAKQKRLAEKKAAEERRKEMEERRQRERDEREKRKLPERRDVELDDLFDSFNVPGGE